MAGLKKLSVDDLVEVLAFLGRVVPRGEVEADRLAGLIEKIRKSLTVGNQTGRV